MDEFLKTDYELPIAGNYMRLEKGDNQFRVMSSAIVGFEYWNNDNKPIRLKDKPESLPEDIRIEKGVTSPIKHFWAFAVYNYKAKSIQILEITQKTIQASIMNLVKNKKWGNPKLYDITITRTGDGFETEYSVVPEPHSDIPEEAFKLYDAKKVNLDALYTGDDPFSGK